MAKISEQAAAKPPVELEGFEVAKKVTYDLWKWVTGEQKFLRFEGPIFKGKTTKGTQAGGQVMEPADLAIVIDLQTGEEKQIIVASVLHSTLREEYPDHSYVGKSFGITQRRDPTKKYNTYSIVEIRAKA